LLFDPPEPEPEFEVLPHAASTTPRTRAAAAALVAPPDRLVMH
jgi:hypothetical protein